MPQPSGRRRSATAKVPNPTAGVTNFGWPCYEGAERQGGYDGADLTLCEKLHIVNDDFRVNVDGVLVVSGRPTSTSRWIEGTATVTVTDGRLTVSHGTGAFNKVNFLDVERPG